MLTPLRRGLARHTSVRFSAVHALLTLAVGMCCAAGCASKASSTTRPAVADKTTTAIGTPVTKVIGTLGDPPLAPREFRALFVSTAYNLDWPPAKNLNRGQQTSLMREIVRRAKEMNCNTVILQVRAFADRVHEVTGLTEPWSKSLNNGNHPNWDPLKEWVAACHDEGLDLYAWINPFRADPNTGDYYAKGQWWYYATDQAVQDYIIECVMHELLNYPDPVICTHAFPLTGAAKVMKSAPATRATALARGGSEVVVAAAAAAPTTTTTRAAAADDGDIDGILFDHYIPPPDPPDPPDPTTQSATQAAMAMTAAAKATKAAKTVAIKRTPRLNIRRNTASVDDFVRRAYEKVNTDRPGARFGLSPGMDQHNVAQPWINNGWCHFIVPELYADLAEPDFGTELTWWINQNISGKVPDPLVVAGLATTRVERPEPKTDPTWPPATIENQVTWSRNVAAAHNKKPGQGHYSYSALRTVTHGGPQGPNNIGDILRDGRYADAHLAPICAPPPVAPPGKPTLQITGKVVTPSLLGLPPRQWEVWFRDKPRGAWNSMRLYGAKSPTPIVAPPTADRVGVRAVDRYGQEGPVAISPI
jgi:uncharacterized lipoprotein YddW (UPF0748 family)